MPSEPLQQEDGVGALSALLASLQPALAAEQMRMVRGSGGLPRWFAPAASTLRAECIEVLALDGTVLFVSDSGALPGDHADLSDPQPGFWLRHGSGEARGALDAANAGHSTQFQAAAETHDGELARWDVTMTPMHTAAGDVDAVLVVSRHNISRQREDALRQKEEAVRKQEEALRRREAAVQKSVSAERHDMMERMDLALGAGPVIGTWVWDLRADKVVADARLARSFAIAPKRLTGLRLDGLLAHVHAEDRAGFTAHITQAARSGGAFRAECRMIWPDGATRWVEASGRCELDGAAQPLRLAGVMVDVHDRVLLEHAAQAKVERQTALVSLGDLLRDTADAASIEAISAGLVGRLLGASNVGYSEIDPQTGRVIIRQDWTDGAAASLAGVYDAAAFPTALAHLRRGLPITEADLPQASWLTPTDRESYRALGRRGLLSLPRLRDARLVATMFAATREPRVWTADEVRFVQDVADRNWAAIDRVQAESALRASAAELRLVADSMPVMISMIDRTLTYQFVNRASVDWIGLAPEQIVGRSAQDVLGAEGFAWRKPYFEAALAGEATRLEAEWPHPDGGPRTAEIRYLPRQDAQGRQDGFYVFVLDITDRKRAEQRLQGSAEALEAEVARRTADRDRMWYLSNDLMLVAAFDGKIEAVNPAWTTLLGWDEAALIGANILDLIHPDELEAAQAEAARLAAGHRTVNLENRLRHQDGSYRWISWSTAPDERFMHAAGRDITADRERETLQRQLEEQLRQSQKMEAVGQLTGGLAHDFNNLLTGITGSLELLQVRLAQGRLNDLERYIAAAKGSASRAAALTHRLLAFSRRQTLDPKMTDVNQLVAGMEALIRGTVGPAIHVTAHLGTELWFTLCDTNQLENALLNLCINARDAMPAGGRLAIETANAWLDEQGALESDMAPGHYVTLTVSDSGTGMTPEVAARAFDPFFTTKPMGEGTGLGLSMIYGFVKQSGGQVRVYTEVGRGTTIQIFLPSHAESAAAAAEPAVNLPAPAMAGETVLLVDDEPTIRLLVQEVLEELGYATILADSGPAGLAVLQSDQRIDLLISDVGLPGGMNGRELAEAARVRRPALKVLFITGYAANAVAEKGGLGAGMHLMTKPFSIDALAAKIRGVLAAD